jgi:hypothetical protein
MKREDKRILKEKEKSLGKAIRLLAKGKGYKSIMGFPYKTIDGLNVQKSISMLEKTPAGNERGRYAVYVCNFPRVWKVAGASDSCRAWGPCL